MLLRLHPLLLDEGGGGHGEQRRVAFQLVAVSKPRSRRFEEVGGEREFVVVSSGLPEPDGEVHDDTDKVHVYAVTPTYYDYNWTVRGGLEPELVEKIKAAFLALDPANPEHKAILDLQRASRFVPTSAENYQGIEEAARAAGLLE